jgi:Rps23 Pro-64 3,4-dihydroxylase Tpa1-like proline 4-hydroxylase
VKLLLAGGQSAALVVPPEHPVLAQLLAAVAGVDGGTKAAHPAVFQIPMEGGRASLAFAANQLVGVVTDPAVLIHSDASGEDDIAAQVPAAPVAAAPAAGAAQGHGELIRHPVVQIDSFLTGSEVAWLMELTFAAESQFVPSRISDNKEDYRQSLMLSAPEALKKLFVSKIQALMPEVMPQLRLGRFAVGDIDCQVTASTDGSYFKAHTDAGANETWKRQFTYVYYFNREPKSFAGGELRIYDDTIRNGKFAATESFQSIEPRHNSIIFFQAAVMHEVMPVHVPSKQFRDSRFTVNGWIARE